jgi:hypothetical protein
MKIISYSMIFTFALLTLCSNKQKPQIPTYQYEFANEYDLPFEIINDLNKRVYQICHYELTSFRNYSVQQADSICKKLILGIPFKEYPYNNNLPVCSLYAVRPYQYYCKSNDFVWEVPILTNDVMVVIFTYHIHDSKWELLDYFFYDINDSRIKIVRDLFNLTQSVPILICIKSDYYSNRYLFTAAGFGEKYFGLVPETKGRFDSKTQVLISSNCLLQYPKDIEYYLGKPSATLDSLRGIVVKNERRFEPHASVVKKHSQNPSPIVKLPDVYKKFKN